MSQGADLIQQHDLYFDGGDRANGSLYLCGPLEGAAAPIEAAIGLLRAAGLWSAEPPKQVAAAQKPAYAEQMVFVDAFAFGDGLQAARYDHAKFPSSAERWEDWRRILLGN